MTGSGLYDKAIRFIKMEDFVREYLKRHLNELPTTSQWYRLKQEVVYGTMQEIKAFLTQRIDKKKTRNTWSFPVENRPLNEWLIETFIDPLLLNYREFKVAYRRFGFNVQLPDLHKRYESEEIQPVILRKALGQFIDHVLLLQNGFEYSENRDQTKMEVFCRD